MSNNDESITTTTTQACAACKHQRRKCVPGCLLAPYFPSSATSSFLNAHKLFGVKKITRALQSLHDPVQRRLAARSIVAHANARAADPSGGCLRIVCDLSSQIEECCSELALVNGQLGLFRAQDHVFLGGGNSIGNVGAVSDVAGDEQMMIMKLLDDKIGFDGFEDEKKGSLFGSRNKFEVKEDVELKREVAQDEETDLKMAASPNLSALSDFIHKVEVES